MKWVVQLCRMGKLLGCRVHFFCNGGYPETLACGGREAGSKYVYGVFCIRGVG